MNTGFFPRFLAESRNRKRGFNSRRLHHFSLGFWISLDPSHQFPALPSILKGKDRNQGANRRKQRSFTGTIDTRTKKVYGRNSTVYRAGYYCPDGKRVIRKLRRPDPRSGHPPRSGPSLWPIKARCPLLHARRAKGRRGSHGALGPIQPHLVCKRTPNLMVP